VRRFALRLARLERQRQPASVRADSEWRGIPIRDLIRFMTSDERSAYRDLLIMARDYFQDRPEAEQEMVREGIRDIMNAAAERVEANEAPPVERGRTIREAYECLQTHKADSWHLPQTVLQISKMSLP
jgi:hypothetical protein